MLVLEGEIVLSELEKWVGGEISFVLEYYLIKYIFYGIWEFVLGNLRKNKFFRVLSCYK